MQSCCWAFCLLSPCYPRAEQHQTNPTRTACPMGSCAGGSSQHFSTRGMQEAASVGMGLKSKWSSPWGCVKWESVANRVLLGLHFSLSGLSRWTQTAQSLFRQSDLSCRGILIVRARRFPLISGVSRYLNGFVVQDFGCWLWSPPCREHTWAAATGCWSRCLGPS